MHRVLWALVALACVYFAIKGWGKATRPQGSDFTFYYEAGRAVLRGEDPLGVEHWIYLPACAVLLAPLAALPYALAAAIWQLGCLAALLWCARCCVGLVQRASRLDGGAPFPPFLLWLPLACLLRLADSNLSYGQINPLVLAAMLAGVEAWSRGRRRAAGAWLGLATAMKVLPGFLLVHLLLRRAWSSLAWGAATVLLVVFVLPVPALGWRGNLSSLGHWWSAMAAPYQRGGEELLESRPYVAGQSLTAAAYRLLTPTSASKGEHGPPANVLDLDPDVVHGIVSVTSAILCALFAATVLARRSRAGSRGWLAEVSLGMCLALMLGPLVHKAHAVWILLPYTLLWTGPGAARAPWRRLETACFAVSVVLVAGTTPALIGRAATTWMLARNAIFWGLAALLVALLVERWAAKDGPVHPVR